MNQLFDGNPVDWADRRKALDPSVFKMRQYVLNISTEATIGGTGKNDKTIDSTPFVLDTITHCIFGIEDDQQDGNYSLDFRHDKVTFNTLPAMSQALYGSVFRGNKTISPSLRQFFRGKSTFNMNVVNYTDWSAVFPTGMIIQVVFHGFEWWEPKTGV